MLRGWGPRAGTGLGMRGWIQLWVGCLLCPVGPPPRQPPGAQVNREAACFQEEEASKGQTEGRKGRGEVVERKGG